MGCSIITVGSQASVEYRVLPHITHLAVDSGEVGTITVHIDAVYGHFRFWDLPAKE